MLFVFSFGPRRNLLENSVPKLAEEEENKSYQNVGDIAKNRSRFFMFSSFFLSSWALRRRAWYHKFSCLITMETGVQSHWDVPRNNPAWSIHKKRR